ncbi:MAG TPA: histidine kinase [Kribbellaceae bacterium]|jgi:signal transduction histidine kinase
MTGLPASGWARRRALAFDALLAGALTLVLVIASADIMGSGNGLGEFAAAGVLAVGQTAPLIWRRASPTAVFAVCAAAAVAQWMAGLQLMPANFGLLFALYAVTVYGPVRASRIALGVGVLGVVMAVTRYYQGGPLRNQATIAIAMGAVVLGVWAFGERRRTNALYVAQLEERAAQLERDRDREAVLAATAERTRIAREIHDVVAHGLSLMIVQADGGLYAADARPDQAKKALATIGDTGRDALAEMRQLLGLLRTDPPATPSTVASGNDTPRPQPGVSQIPELVGTVRDAGLDVELSVTGNPRELMALLGLTAYRIVQEGLTNALKHAGPGTRATVRLDYGTDALTVEVADDGRGAAAATADGPGHGLAGMRQRVSVSGGTVTAGPRPGGGYAVTARLPYDPLRYDVPAGASPTRPDGEGAPLR